MGLRAALSPMRTFTIDHQIGRDDPDDAAARGDPLEPAWQARAAGAPSERTAGGRGLCARDVSHAEWGALIGGQIRLRREWTLFDETADLEADPAADGRSLDGADRGHHQQAAHAIVSGHAAPKRLNPHPPGPCLLKPPLIRRLHRKEQQDMNTKRHGNPHRSVRRPATLQDRLYRRPTRRAADQKENFTIIGGGVSESARPARAHHLDPARLQHRRGGPAAEMPEHVCMTTARPRRSLSCQGRWRFLLGPLGRPPGRSRWRKATSSTSRQASSAGSRTSAPTTE